jgi:hypothetical protein
LFEKLNKRAPRPAEVDVKFKKTLYTRIGKSMHACVQDKQEDLGYKQKMKECEVTIIKTYSTVADIDSSAVTGAIKDYISETMTKIILECKKSGIAEDVCLGKAQTFYSEGRDKTETLPTYALKESVKEVAQEGLATTLSECQYDNKDDVETCRKKAKDNFKEAALYSGMTATAFEAKYKEERDLAAVQLSSKYAAECKVDQKKEAISCAEVMRNVARSVNGNSDLSTFDVVAEIASIAPQNVAKTNQDCLAAASDAVDCEALVKKEILQLESSFSGKAEEVSDVKVKIYIAKGAAKNAGDKFKACKKAQLTDPTKKLGCDSVFEKELKEQNPRAKTNVKVLAAAKKEAQIAAGVKK